MSRYGDADYDDMSYELDEFLKNHRPSELLKLIRDAVEWWEEKTMNRMDELKPLICPNCGGKINAARMRCEYCGTEFKREEGPALRIEAVRPGVRTLEANVRIPEYYIQHLLRNSDNDEIVNMVGDQMTHDLAKALVPMLDLKVGHDLERMEAVVRGRIRVLEPGYRF